MDVLTSPERREAQLDALSGLLTLAMAVVVGLLLFVLASSGIALPVGVPLSGYADRLLLGVFVLLLLVYLNQQKRLLRAQITRARAETEKVKAGLEATCRYLEFSHSVASQLGGQGVAGTMNGVLERAAVLFGADAAAVLGQDGEYLSFASGCDEGAAHRALNHVVAVAAGKEGPFYSESLGAEGGHTIAAPLRISGDLRYLLALWKRDAEFDSDQLEALALLGRMVELALEREDSLEEARAQVQGTLRVLQYLVADKRPDFSRHSEEVARLADAVGTKLGLGSQARKELRLAGLLHDVGLMTLGAGLADADKPMTPEEAVTVRQHARVGGEIARAANFGSRVQEAIAAHHERMDGSGYPLGLRGTEVPIEARIVAACEAYDSMTNRDYHGTERAHSEAVAELAREAGTHFDPDVVEALEQVLAEEGAATEAAATKSAVASA
ncbi:MAG TPA: HD domain-containing phosphohydrolase [Coriobacteriia bacterium]